MRSSGLHGSQPRFKEIRHHVLMRFQTDMIPNMLLRFISARAISKQHHSEMSNNVPACKACCVCRRNWHDHSFPTPGLSPADIALIEFERVTTSRTIEYYIKMSNY